MNKSLLMRSIIVGVVSGIVLYGIAIPRIINADAENLATQVNSSTLIHDGHLTICKMDKSSYEVVKTVKMIVTAYSSTPEQTDSTPFINAAGEHVKDGDIAINGVPFGTRVRIPALYGNRVFIVKDRLHERMGTRHADIWMAEYQLAKNFGAKYNIEIEMLES